MHESRYDTLAERHGVVVIFVRETQRVYRSRLAEILYVSPSFFANFTKTMPLPHSKFVTFLPRSISASARAALSVHCTDKAHHLFQ
jgi:hypothetical protein